MSPQSNKGQSYMRMRQAVNQPNSMRNDPDFILPEVKSSYQFNTMTNSREFSKQNSPKNEDKHNLIQIKEA